MEILNRKRIGREREMQLAQEAKAYWECEWAEVTDSTVCEYLRRTGRNPEWEGISTILDDDYTN